MSKMITVTKPYLAFTKVVDGETVIDCKTDAMSLGKHPLQDEFDFVETDDKALYDAWEVYVPPQPVKFNAQKVKGELLSVFATKLKDLVVFYSPIGDCIEFIEHGDKVAAKGALQQYIDGLIKDGIFTKQDYDALKSVIESNGEVLS